MGGQTSQPLKAWNGGGWGWPKIKHVKKKPRIHDGKVFPEGFMPPWRIQHESHTCSELSLRILLWNASYVQRHQQSNDIMKLHTYIHTHTQTYIHTYIHTYTHTYIHTHTHIHTYTHTLHTLHYITLYYITLHYIPLHTITYHYIPLHYHYITITCHYMPLHYIT